MFDINEIREEHRGRRIAILGNGVSSRDWTGKYMDFSHSYDDIWVVNGGQSNHPTASLEFMMDDHLGPAMGFSGIPEDVRDDYIKQSKIPIITCNSYDGFPPLTEYPLREILDFHKTAYFGETLSYMVAFALWCGVKAIHFHGTDYQNCKPAERASTEYWCGIARMFKGEPREGGVEVMVNPQSHFLCPQVDGINVHIPYFYGYIPDTFPLKLEFEEDGSPIISFDDKERRAEVVKAKERLLRERYGQEKAAV